MMGLLAKLGIGLAGEVIGIFSEGGKAKAAETATRIQNMGRSWTDEFIVLVFFTPIIIGWFSPDSVYAYFQTLGSMPEWYTALVIGITAAVFGLGKIKTP